MRSHIWKDDIYFLSQKTTYEQFIIRVDGHAPAFDELFVGDEQELEAICNNTSSEEEKTFGTSASRDTKIDYK